MSTEKLKINYVELTGNLARDAKVTGEYIFITVATYNGNDRPATFIDVALFNHQGKDLKKGDRVTIKGNLTNYKDKTTNYTKTGVVSLSCKLLAKTEESSLDSFIKENEIDDIPWEYVKELLEI